MKSKEEIKFLYEHYKNSEKKLKIVCDWDEVIQACEPFALWLAKREVRTEPTLTKPVPKDFKEYFDNFWGNNTTINNPSRVNYFGYGSSLSDWCISLAKSDYSEDIIDRQVRIKNSPNLYQEAPFLTIAGDLLKLIKEDKVEKLIFLSAYDKRKFPKADMRKYEIFCETFAKLAKNWSVLDAGKDWNDGIVGGVLNRENEYLDRINLQLIPFESETQGQSETDWIKENAADFDLVIEDNPRICRSLVMFVKEVTARPSNYPIIAPYYPAIKHAEGVLLVKNEVSELKKEEFEIK